MGTPAHLPAGLTVGCVFAEKKQQIAHASTGKLATVFSRFFSLVFFIVFRSKASLGNF